jgi:mevalonate kinase
MAGKGTGQGKVIIFGEHFVVHGAPAIAGGISNTAVVEVARSDRNRIITEQKVVEEYSLKGIEAVLGSMGIMEKYDVKLAGDLPTYGGLGSSAAFCVALTNALAQEKGLHLTKDQVNRHAYEGEKAFHGNPSGIDNTIATHGGVVEFTRGKTPAESRFVFLELKKPLDLVVSFSGKYGPTSKMVERVGEFKEKDEAEFAQLMDEYMKIAMEGRKAIEKGRIDVIGQLMNENQELLSELGVSDEANDRIVRIAMEAGALGSKVTGGGGGGCCITLADGAEKAKGIARILDSEGYKSFFTRIAK